MEWCLYELLFSDLRAKLTAIYMQTMAFWLRNPM